MSYNSTPHYCGRTLFSSYEARTESKLYIRHRLLAETRHDIRRTTNTLENSVLDYIVCKGVVPFLHDEGADTGILHIPVESSTSIHFCRTPHVYSE
jgi:hypothetical protein